MSVDIAEARACSRNALSTLDSEGCELFTPRLARTHKGVPRNGEQSELTLNEMFGTRRNVEGDTKLLAKLSAASPVGDQPLATWSESLPC